MCGYVCEREKGREKGGKRGRESVSARLCVCVCVERERESEKEREREREQGRERGGEGERERERERGTVALAYGTWLTDSFVCDVTHMIPSLGQDSFT